MTIIEIKSIIDLLKKKRDYAVDHPVFYRSGSQDIDPKHFQEYKTLFSTLVFEIGKQNPTYLANFTEVTNSGITFQHTVNKLEGILSAIEEEIKIGTIGDGNKNNKIDAESILENIFDKFHACCRQARSRHDNRPTIDVKDEYDVQDLLHVFLKLHFSDIRPEEWTPSYAGQSARMDFLIKDYDTVIETKKTRDTLRDKEIGKQLIEDIARYKNHPNCHKLYCFVYDPEGHIGNPRGLENDLSNTRDNISIKVVVKP